MTLKRLPGLAFKFKWISIIIILIFSIFLFAIFWGFICFDKESWNHVKRMCVEFGFKKEPTTDLCSILCSAETGVKSVSCIRSERAGNHNESRTIFTAVLRVVEGIEVVFKSFKLYGPIDYTIIDWVKSVKKSHPHLTHSILNADSGQLRQNKMSHLLRDNEYLLAHYYGENEIFPRLIGFCENFYVLESLPDALAQITDDGKTIKSWYKRIQLAVEMLQLVEQIDQEHLLMCHVTPSKFGLTERGKLKLTDLEMVFPKEMIDLLVSNGKYCSTDHDCSFYDCKSICNIDTHKCDSPVVRSNIQIICEKIFIGWSLPGRLLVPGLLMSINSPNTLTSLLRQCANGAHSQELSAHITTRLSDTLTELANVIEKKLH